MRTRYISPLYLPMSPLYLPLSPLFLPDKAREAAMRTQISKGMAERRSCDCPPVDANPNPTPTPIPYPYPYA